MHYRCNMVFYGVFRYCNRCGSEDVGGDIRDHWVHDCKPDLAVYLENEKKWKRYEEEQQSESGRD